MISNSNTNTRIVSLITYRLTLLTRSPLDELPTYYSLVNLGILLADYPILSHQKNTRHEKNLLL